MKNEDEISRRCYDEEVRLRGSLENIEELKGLFAYVAEIKTDVLDEALRSENWEKTDGTPGFFVYRRPESEHVYYEVVLPEKRDVLYAAFILKAASRYAEYKKASLVATLEKWIRLESEQNASDAARFDVSNERRDVWVPRKEARRSLFRSSGALNVTGASARR